MRDRVAGLFERAARALRGIHPCPHCTSPRTRPNHATSVSGARLCDACGTRWRP